MSVNERTTILSVCSKGTDHSAIEIMGKELGVEIVKADTGKNVVDSVRDTEFAMILIDLDMCEADGLATAEIIRSNLSTKRCPIVFITEANQDKQYIFKGYELGVLIILTNLWTQKF